MIDGKRAIPLYFFKRIALYILTMFIAISICFFLFRLVPGNPIANYIYTMEATYGRYMKEEEKISLVEYYTKTFGLDRDLFTQYLCFLKELVLNRNLGPSFMSFPTPAQELILQRLPYTIGLLSLSTILSWLIGNLLGAFIGWRRNSKLDKAIFILALGFAQIPFYIIGVLLVLLFSCLLGWLPMGGAYSPDVTPGLTLKFVGSLIRHAILPSITIVMTSFCGWIITMRSMVITVLGEDYILFAEAKGLKRNRIFTRYVLKNALLPQVTGLGISAGFIVSGSVVVETMFRYPGIGSLFSAALGLLDYNTINGCLILIVFSVLTANLITDLLLPFIDPRVIESKR